jgi:hypothetical protein
MKKKTILLLVALSLVAMPLAASAAEFTLGGYIKMETIWDSTQIQKNLLSFIPRNNNANMQHGRLIMTAENSRMWFLIKGPKVWGAETTGYVEWDFDEHANVNTAAGGLSYSPNKARLGLRHAFFRLNWPDTELLMGQYWSLLTEEIPETVSFGADTVSGQPFLRTPQIRLTQVFGIGPGKLTSSIALCEPGDGLWGLSLDPTQTAVANNFTGESAETPKVEARVKYEADLWGKGAFWGAPRPFSIRFAGAWWRERFRDTFATAAAPQNGIGFGQNSYTNIFYFQRDQQYLNKWIVEGSLFIPIIPTYTTNFAGTMNLLTQWYVGSGVDGYFEDFPSTATFMNPVSGLGTAANPFAADRYTMNRFGGFVQLQYWFTNQWYMNALYGLTRAFAVPSDWIGINNVVGTGAGTDPVKTNQAFYLALWYRPIQALKFGLEYTYTRTDYFQSGGANVATIGAAPTGTITNLGENHRVMFGGYFFF